MPDKISEGSHGNLVCDAFLNSLIKDCQRASLSTVYVSAACLGAVGWATPIGATDRPGLEVATQAHPGQPIALGGRLDPLDLPPGIGTPEPMVSDRPEVIGRPESIAPRPQLIAQVTAAPDGTNTVVTPGAGGTQYDVTGGTAAGKNLFHSFQEFGVPLGNTANINAPTGVQNILGRVVGGQPSNILGTLQVTGGTANLYLMNPAGILFGPGAQLNIPGAFVATTANGVRIDAQWFNAAGSNNYATLVGDPTGLGFNLTGVTPAAISNAGSLTAKTGQSIVLVGGPLSNTGTITAPGGIALVAAPNQTLVQLTQPGNPLSLQIALPANGVVLPQDLPTLLTGGSAGLATLATGSLSTQVTQGNAGAVTVIADRQITAGSINTSSTGSRGNGGSVTLTSRNGGIASAGPILTTSTNGNSGAVTLSAAGDLQTGAITTSSQRAQTTAGAITLTSAANVKASGELAARSGQGNGGVITITAGQGLVADQIDASTQATGANSGNGGDVALTAQNGGIQANSLSTFATGQRGNTGNGGSVTLNATNGDVAVNTINTQTRVDELGAAGRGGDVAISVTNGNARLGGINTSSITGSTTSQAGSGGNISIQVRRSIGSTAGGSLTVQPGSRLNTSINGKSGTAGNVTLTASQIDLGDQAGQSILAAPLDPAATGGVITLIGDDINFSGLLSGRSVTLQPLTPSRPINVGGRAQAGALNLEQAKLDRLKAGFERVTIGSTAGSGALQVTANLTFIPELILQSPQPGGSITTTGQILKGSSITLNAPKISQGEIQVTGQLNIINGAPVPPPPLEPPPAPPLAPPLAPPPAPSIQPVVAPVLPAGPQDRSSAPIGQLGLDDRLTQSAAANSPVPLTVASPNLLTVQPLPPAPPPKALAAAVPSRVVACPKRLPQKTRLTAVALLSSAAEKLTPGCQSPPPGRSNPMP
jgi:filamentous hemagglutinin family protein